jgi:hypothetical protein
MIGGGAALAAAAIIKNPIATVLRAVVIASPMALHGAA